MNYWLSVILAAGIILFLSLGLILLAARRRRRLPAVESYAPALPLPAADPDPDSIPIAERLATQREMAGLRQDVANLRQEVASLRQELERVRTQQVASAARPGYTDAITLAREGASAQLLADRCGISHSEAELIVALHGRSMTH